MTTFDVTLPSLYEYYGNNITTGLSVDQPYFTLNNRNISIYSGTVHYFRVPKAYWRDRLRKLRAAGLNTVETYVPWNLHEPENGQFDFGNGGSDMQEFLNVQEFLKIAKEEDLFAIVRPGPYICAEWELGGFPSWLLREPNIKLRTSDPVYMKYVNRFFNMLLPLLTMLQFTKGGPIIAVQVENEYGSTERKNFTPDRVYLQQLRELMLRNGIEELLFTSDDPVAHGAAGTLPGVLFQTANFDRDPESRFNALKKLQPGKPYMATEFWSGWFDHWSETHHKTDRQSFAQIYETILNYPASVNLYMFHGGTSWGFMNGGNFNNDKLDNSGYQPDTTSYDYDAPLTENGDYTEKYIIIRNLIKKYNKIETRLPPPPTITPTKKYNNIQITEQILLPDLLEQSISFFSENLLPMELLDINNNSGQSYGYIVYKKTKVNIQPNSVLKIIGHVCDTVVVLINNKLYSPKLKNVNDFNNFGYWRKKNSTLSLGNTNLTDATLILMVENFGRGNFGANEQIAKQFKGLWQGGVFLNNEELLNWEIFPLEFKKKFTTSLIDWSPIENITNEGPVLTKSNFYIEDEVQDTFIDMRNWSKGIVIVNGFVLGRYAVIGPQQTLYLPAPFLQSGNNTILIFEHFKPYTDIVFSDRPIFHTVIQCM